MTSLVVVVVCLAPHSVLWSWRSTQAAHISRTSSSATNSHGSSKRDASQIRYRLDTAINGWNTYSLGFSVDKHRTWWVMVKYREARKTAADEWPQWLVDSSSVAALTIDLWTARCWHQVSLRQTAVCFCDRMYFSDLDSSCSRLYFNCDEYLEYYRSPVKLPGSCRHDSVVSR